MIETIRAWNQVPIWFSCKAIFLKLRAELIIFYTILQKDSYDVHDGKCPFGFKVTILKTALHLYYFYMEKIVALQKPAVTQTKCPFGFKVVTPHIFTTHQYGIICFIF